MSTSPDIPELQGKVQYDGFVFVKADSMRLLLGEPEKLADWDAFVSSWSDLAPDTYLAAQGRQRRRRHAVFTFDASAGIERLPPQPHYQNLQYNALQGGIQRWFVPIRPAIADGMSMLRILDFTRKMLGGMDPTVPKWQVEAHQFRIEAGEGMSGEPTPEGIHRDGVDYVLVLLISRQNIESGTTTIHDHNNRLLGNFTLNRSLDAALVDDERVLHGVTPVTAFDPTKPAHRDVLVVTLKAIAP